MMRGAGRAPPAVCGLLPRWFGLCALIAVADSSDYGVPIEIKLWDSGRTPLSHMVDITNEFGLKVLAEHNFLNDNNIAFSPYGLTGILVALYEGIDGESSFQIQRGMHLPWNRNVMRIGFRDIHRTLKTYFVPEEGFLAGLALNNENVTFNDSYRKILRFYGFDLENDQLPTLPPGNETTQSSTPASTDKSNESTTVAMTAETTPKTEDASSTPSREETTPNPNAETINEVDIRGPSTTTMSPNAENVSPDSTTIITMNTQTSTPETTEPSAIIITTTAMPTDAINPTMSDSTITTPVASREETIVTVPESTSTTSEMTPTSDEPKVDNEVDVGSTPGEEMPAIEEASSTTIETTTITSESSSSTTTTVMTTTVTANEQTEQSTAPTTDMNTVPDIDTTSNGSSLETLERRKKSIVDFIFTNPPYIDDYLVYRSYDIGLDLPISNKEDNNFLANGLRNVQVTYMHYDTILDHAYLPHLEASALRLPLDSERYYLLVVLPSRAGPAELGRLLSRMARESDLSDVYSVLRPRRVRAVVPSFTVKGHVTLTTDLQKLGIRDVFEPRQQDFTPMTRQPGVYVRSIEQAVSVAIRKYRPDDQKKNRYVTNRQPVVFTATYPFLYFVMDSSIHVALMAGKMVDPLNTRIL